MKKRMVFLSLLFVISAAQGMKKIVDAMIAGALLESSVLERLVNEGVHRKKELEFSDKCKSGSVMYAWNVGGGCYFQEDCDWKVVKEAGALIGKKILDNCQKNDNDRTGLWWKPLKLLFPNYLAGWQWLYCDGKSLKYYYTQEPNEYFIKKARLLLSKTKYIEELERLYKTSLDKLED